MFTNVNKHTPYVRLKVGFPFWSSTVMALALKLDDPYLWRAASRLRGRPDGIWKNERMNE